MIKCEDLTKTEKSLLLYLETCLVDHRGRVQSARMNKEDFEAIKHLESLGLIVFFRRRWSEIRGDTKKGIKRGTGINTHEVRFSQEAWDIAHQLRRERAEKYVATFDHHRVGRNERGKKIAMGNC